MKRLIPYVAILAVATAAPAMALNTPVVGAAAPATNGSSLLLGVYDSTTGNSLTVNLGYSFADLISATSSALSGAFTPDTLGSPFTAATVNGQSVYQLSFGSIALSSVASTPGATTQYFVEAINGAGTGQIFSAPSANPAVTSITNSINTTNTAITNFVANLSSGSVLDTNDATNLNGTFAGALANTITGLMGGTSINGTVGTTLSLYSIVANPVRGQVNAAVTQFANALGNGFFLLDTAGKLSWNVLAAAPVPLPAAAWLLLSGLGGLGAIGRRRRAIEPVAAAA